MDIKKINEALDGIKDSLVESEPLFREDQKKFKAAIKKEALKYIGNKLIKDLGKISDSVIKQMGFNKDDTVFIEGIGDAMLSDYILQVIHDNIYLVRPSKVPTFKD